MKAKVARMIVSALSAGGIAFFTGVVTTIQGNGEITKGVIWLCTGFGVIAVCKDIQASLSTPPQVEEKK